MSEQKLSELRKGEKGRILRIVSADLQMKLMRLGVITGDTCILSNIAPLGDPIAISVNGTKVTMRLRDADSIRIERL